MLELLLKHAGVEEVAGTRRLEKRDAKLTRGWIEGGEDKMRTER